MNKYLTYTAMAKLLSLITDEGAHAVRITSQPRGSVSFEMLHERQPWTDLMISATPKVYTNFYTFDKLDSAAIDFDYSSSEFIITRQA